jgi:hypothetical protein
MTPTSAVIEWAKGLLLADATVTSLVADRIFDTVAPPGTSGDMILLLRQSYTERGTSQSGELGTGRMLLTVKSVCRSTGLARNEAINEAAHTVLQGQNGTSGGHTISKCIREQIHSPYPETAPGQGVQYNHYPMVYCLMVD